jgi:hypothetical protein
MAAEGRAQIDMKPDTLDRIVLLLFALSNLAVRAAAAPSPLRWLALFALHYAHVVARDYVACPESGRAPRLPAVASIRYGSDAADAINLALSLRLLALAVRAIAARERRQRLAVFGRNIGEGGRDRAPLQRRWEFATLGRGLTRDGPCGCDTS